MQVKQGGDKNCWTYVTTREDRHPSKKIDIYRPNSGWTDITDITMLGRKLDALLQVC